MNKKRTLPFYRSCQGVQPIADVLKEKCFECNDMCLSLRMLQDDLVARKDRKEKQKNSLETETNDFSTLVGGLRSKINSVIDEIQNTILQKHESIIRDKKGEYQRYIDECQEKINHLNKLCSNLLQTRQTCETSVLYCLKKYSEERHSVKEFLREEETKTTSEESSLMKEMEAILQFLKEKK